METALPSRDEEGLRRQRERERRHAASFAPRRRQRPYSCQRRGNRRSRRKQKGSCILDTLLCCSDSDMADGARMGVLFGSDAEAGAAAPAEGVSWVEGGEECDGVEESL